MNGVTFFAAPKAFEGRVATIQRNAVASWRAASPQSEILLFGRDAGIAEVRREFGLRHDGEVATNEFGTPLVSDLFERARRLATRDILCYLNADILLTSNPEEALGRIPFETFLVVGRRWDLEGVEPLRFEGDWAKRLVAQAAARGALHGPTGIDYFIFPRSLALQGMPPFAIGRPAWDNWVIFQARKQGVPVIDATAAIPVLHQNHPHAPTTVDPSGAWVGPECERNLTLAGDLEHCFTIQDATWLLNERGLEKPKPTLAYVWRNLETLPALYEDHSVFGWLARPAVSLQSASRRAARRFVRR